MNKRNFVFNYVPLKSDFDDLQNDMEAGIKDVAKAVAGMGILSGLTVNIASSEATISPGTAFDGQGNRIELEEALEVNIGSITRPSAGKYKWVTLALRYEVADEGQLIDGNNKRWPARLLDSYSALFLEGDEETAEAAVKPAFQNWQVPLLDILVDRSSTWENLVTETGRRPILIPISTASAQLEAHKDVSITSSNAVHGIRQGSGHGFDADLLDGKHYSEILSAIYPVGFIYAQYPGGQTPAAMGWPGTWESLYETEGVFFRTPGGLASTFGSADIQEDAMQGMTGWIRDVAHGGAHEGSSAGVFEFNQGSSWGNAGGGGRTDSFHFDNSRQVRTATETRPRNRTFRIWKRSA